MHLHDNVYVVEKESLRVDDQYCNFDCDVNSSIFQRSSRLKPPDPQHNRGMAASMAFEGWVLLGSTAVVDDGQTWIGPYQLCGCGLVIELHRTDDHKQRCSGRPGHLPTNSLCFPAFRSALHSFAPYQVQPPRLETSSAKNMFEDSCAYVVDALLITGRRTLQRAKPTGAGVRPQNMLRRATLNTDISSRPRILHGSCVDAKKSTSTFVDIEFYVDNLRLVPNKLHF